MSRALSKIYISVLMASIVLAIMAPQMARATSAGSDAFNKIINPQASPIAGTLYVRGFVYPIVELGNCSSKSNCFDYCEQMSNVPACADFSERHGIMPAGSAAATQKLVEALLAGNRPGPCNSLNDCVTYCDKPSSYDDCTAYVQKIGLNTAVLGASDTVAVIPRGLLNYCNTAQSCATYCASVSNADCAGLPIEQQKAPDPQSFVTPDIQKLIDSSQAYKNGNLGAANASLYGSTTNKGVNPRVKSVSSVDPDQIYNQLQNCLNNAQGSIVNIQPPAGTPPSPFGPQVDTRAYEQQQNQCQQQAQDQSPTSAQALDGGRAQALDGIKAIEDCLANVKDFARDFQACLTQ